MSALDDAQLMKVHGFGRVPWWHASIPTATWTDLSQQPNGCWTSRGPMTRVHKNRRMMILRLANRNPSEAFAITPTCGDGRCCRPEHLCVTMETPLSYSERT